MLQDAIRLVVLISGNGSNLQAIMDACANNTLNAEVVAVISNQPDAYGLERAQQARIDAHTVEYIHFKDRDQFDQALTETIEQYDPDLVVLAGFMRILTPDFVKHFSGRLLNIHPSLLPKFKGLNTYARALAANEPFHGTSVHFVTETLDGGPVIAQVPVRVHEGDTVETLRDRVVAVEHKLYPLCIKWFAENRLHLNNGKASLDGTVLQDGGRSIQPDQLDHALNA